MFNLTNSTSTPSVTPSAQESKSETGPLPFTVAQPRILARSVQRGDLSEHMTLEALRDDLRKLHTEMAPEDRTFDLDTLAIGFPKGQVKVARIIGRDRQSRPVGCTPHGWSLLSKALFRGRDGRRPIPQADKLIRDAATRGLRGQQLATLMATQYARGASEGWEAGANRSHLFRLATINGERVIRSVHSTRYAAYDHVHLCENLIEALGGDTRVLSCNVSDTGMIVKMTTTPEAEISLHTPIPIIQAGNSEVGLRSAWIEGGMWKLVCLNGMGSWQSHRQAKFRHIGDSSRITNGILDSVEAIQATSQGLIQDYDQALGTTIDDAFAWMMDELHGRLPERTVTRVREGMQDPTSSQEGTLANVIDGMTLIAQDDHLDPFAGWEIEREASRLMSRGLRQARGRRIEVTA